MKKILSIGLALLLQTTASAITYCPVTMIPDIAFPPFAYKAILVLPKTCPSNGVALVRKSTTLSTKAKGARYQPTFPGGRPEFGGKWSWKMTKFTSEVPRDQLWTSRLWEWQYYDGKVWRRALTP